MNHPKNRAIKEFRDSEKGFSLVEMIVVLVIIAIVSVVAFMTFATQKMYEAESQTLIIIDFLQEARQRALSQRTTMRVEINATRGLIRLIDEKLPLNAADDVVVKSAVRMSNDVYVGPRPANVTSDPTELSPVPVAVFAPSSHPLSPGDSVIVLRFQRNGIVYDAGTNGAGANATATGSTIYVWSKYTNDTTPVPVNAQIARGITVLASSGSSKMWKCLIDNGSCATWTK